VPAAAQHPAPPFPSAAPAGLKLRRLEIENFKAIDKLVLDLPGPLMGDDPDVFVIGSKNGAGKTSILEACVLAYLGAFYPALFQAVVDNAAFLRDHLIRSDKPILRLRTTFADHPSLAPEVEGSFSLVLSRFSEAHSAQAPVVYPDLLTGQELELLVLEPFLGDSQYSLVLHDCIYFHCNRRVPRGHVLGISGSSSAVRQPDTLLHVGSRGWIKHELLRFLMAQAGLFEDIRSASVTETAAVLDDLFREFANVRLFKLRSVPDKAFAFDIRVHPLVGDESFSFDALSSGQKEMITTLFLIWQHTRERPGLVLIDEPELHLNAEWQVKFVRLLFKLAPWNQYIMATHSQFIFESVQEDRRLLIGPRG
jgi:hypothetical protein